MTAAPLRSAGVEDKNAMGMLLKGQGGPTIPDRLAVRLPHEKVR